MASTGNIVYGGDLMLFINSGATVQPIGFSTSAKLSVTMKTREITSKDSVGDFAELTTGKFSWNISTDSLVNYTSTGTTMSTEEIYQNMYNKKLMNISFGVKTGSSPSWTVDSSKKRFTGTGYITSFDLNASDGDNSTSSITIDGTSVLTLT